MKPQEHIVARADELKEGQMKQVEAGGRKILLCRVNGRFHAIGGECTHYGAPLAEGVLDGAHVRCPWHHACFDVRTGNALEPPALDGAVNFEVRVEDGNVIVAVPPGAPQAAVAPMARRSPSDGRTFVIVGAGAAGSIAAETLRQDGFEGRIVMITREGRLPYDRTSLTKGYLRDPAASPPMLRSEDFYAGCDIELMLETPVASLDAATRTVTFGDGSALRYDRALIATGAEPRRLQVPGADLANVFALRSLDDCDRIRAAAESASAAVLVGASFIAMEAAAALVARGLAVTIVAPDDVPFRRTLGERIGRMYQRLHEEKGVRFCLGAAVRRLEGTGTVRAAVLDTGERVEADMVLAGIGVRPVSDYLQGVPVNPDGSVTVDGLLRAAEDLWAAGDVATFVDWRNGQHIRIEHWRLAQQHGRVAAHNMAGRQAEYRRAPFFWTMQHSVATGYVGYAGDYEEIVFDGDVDQRDFIAFYIRQGRVTAVAACGREAQLAAAAELVLMDRLPAPQELRGGRVDLVQRMRSAYLSAISPEI